MSGEHDDGIQCNASWDDHVGLGVYCGGDRAIDPPRMKVSNCSSGPWRANSWQKRRLLWYYWGEIGQKWVMYGEQNVTLCARMHFLVQVIYCYGRSAAYRTEYGWRIFLV